MEVRILPLQLIVFSLLVIRLCISIIVEAFLFLKISLADTTVDSSKIAATHIFFGSLYVIRIVTIQYPTMKLLLYLANDFIDEVPLCPESITLPGYVGKMKKKLLEKYNSLINQANVEPEFLVVKVSKKEKKQA